MYTNIFTLTCLLITFQRVLDYLKIDVEGHEWSVIDYLLKNGITPRIRHFSLEYHIFPDWPDKARYPDLLRTYKRLKEAGFYKYFTGIHPLNHTPKKFNIQADVCYVNIKFQSWQNCDCVVYYCLVFWSIFSLPNFKFIYSLKLYKDGTWGTKQILSTKTKSYVAAEEDVYTKKKKQIRGNKCTCR